jgi:hypothetical protein
MHENCTFWHLFSFGPEIFPEFCQKFVIKCRCRGYSLRIQEY